MVLAAISTYAHAQPVPYGSATDPRPLGRWADASASAFDAFGNGFVIGAFSDMDEQSGEEIGSNVGVHLTKFSPTGQVLWRTETPFSTTDDFPFHYEVWPTSDGGAIVHFDSFGPKYVEGTLMRYDSQGHVQWANGNFDTAAAAGDGTSFGFQDSIDDYPTFFYKLNAAGVQQWKATIEQPYVFLGAIVPDGNGGAWAAGTSHPSYQDYHLDLTVFHFNSSGQFQSWTYDGVNIEPSSIRLDYAGNVVIGGTGPADSNTTRYIALAKVNSAGALLWSKILDDPVDWSARWDRLQYEVDPSNNIFVGYQRENSIMPVLLKLAPDGSTLWSKTYSIANSNSLFLAQFLIDPGGNAFALYGHSDKFAGYDYNLVKYLPGGGLGWPLPNGALVYDRGPIDYPAGLGRDQAGLLYMAGVSQGDGDRLGHNVVRLGPANNATFISESVPSSMVAGQTYAVSLTFNNNGVNPWSFGDNDYLRFTSPTDSDLWGVRRVNLGSSEVISPGGSKTFKFNVIAPMNGGSYGFQYRMAQGTGSFGSASPQLNIPVVVKQHAARYLSQSVPSSVKAGSTFSVTVTMENVGTNTWTKAAGYALASTNPDLNTVWGVSAVPMGSLDSVARGQSKAFTFTCVAPTTPGSYTMRWTMRRQASAFTGMFGDKTTTKTITVTP